MFCYTGVVSLYGLLGRLYHHVFQLNASDLADDDSSYYLRWYNVVGRSHKVGASELWSPGTLIPWSLPMMHNVGGMTLGVGVDKEFVGVILVIDGISADDETMSAEGPLCRC